MKNILILDIETSPNLAYVWRAYKENIGYNQFVNHSTIMCWAAKWLTQDRVFYDTCKDKSEKEVVTNLCSLLDAADIVVAHNGDKFDIPVIRSRSVELGILPFSPIRTIDTLRVASKLFKFPMNSLAFLSRYLGVTQKKEHEEFPGFELWNECLKGNEKAWEVMRIYNTYDVLALEEVYLKLLPWMTEHPNVSSNSPDEIKCPRCGGEVIRRGFYESNVGKYQRYRCKDCGGWSRSRYTENTFEERQKILTAT